MDTASIDGEGARPERRGCLYSSEESNLGSGGASGRRPGIRVEKGALCFRGVLCYPRRRHSLAAPTLEPVPFVEEQGEKEALALFRSLSAAALGKSWEMQKRTGEAAHFRSSVLL